MNPTNILKDSQEKGKRVMQSPFIPETDSLVIGTKSKIEGLIRKGIDRYETIPGTDIEVEILGDEYLVNGRRVVAINNGCWRFFDAETLQEVKLYQKGTKKQIWVFHDKYSIGNREFYRAAFMGDDNKNAILCADSLELAKMNIGREKVKKEIVIDNIVDQEIIHGKMVWNIQTEDKKMRIIIPKTMRELELRIKGTNEKIVRVYDKAKKFGNIKVQLVHCENGKFTWINASTLEKVNMKLKGTDIKILEIYKPESVGGKILQAVTIDDKNWGFMRDSERQIVYIDTHTMEPLMYKGKYVTNLKRIDKNHVSFNLNGSRDVYIFETKK